MHDARTDQIDYHCVILIERSARLKIVFFTIDTYQSTYDNDHIIIVIITVARSFPARFTSLRTVEQPLARSLQLQLQSRSIGIIFLVYLFVQ